MSPSIPRLPAGGRIDLSIVDLFIEHGSTSEDDSLAKSMPAWGDTQILTPQQIADLTAYIISLNK